MGRKDRKGVYAASEAFEGTGCCLLLLMAPMLLGIAALVWRMVG